MRNALLRIGLLAMLVALTMVGVGGSSLAAGDLFDKAYKDCPHKTRLRDGQIDDLAVARDAEEAGEVNVSWAATDPSTWGLGPNEFNTSLVVILEDGSDTQTETLSLGTRKVTFEGVETGKKVTVEMAIVTNTADGKYLISDIQRESILQSLTKPSFSTGWNEITATGDADDDKAGFQLSTSAVDAGMLYYIGYNQNFGNYKSDDSNLKTSPSTARLRIGLAHSGEETDEERGDVNFNAYIIRITDEDGNVVSEGDDVATRESGYGSVTYTYTDTDGTDRKETFGKQLVVYGLDPFGIKSDAPDKGTVVDLGDNNQVGGSGDDADTNTKYALINVRIVDGDNISVAMHNSSAVTRSGTAPNPNSVPLSTVRVDDITDVSDLAVAPEGIADAVYAAPPDEHRDFPIDTFTSDETYTIAAWAINDDDEVISPIATLKVRPKDTDRDDVSNFQDYLNNLAGATEAANIVAVDDLTTTEFTVLK